MKPTLREIASTLDGMLSLCEPEPSSGCWIWTRSTNTDSGYGDMRWRGRHEYAHRLAWELKYGPIPDGLQVLHRCDNPPCCNPVHLFLGTQTDNVADMVAKGRCASGDNSGARTHPERLPRGDRNGSKTHPDRVPRGDRNGTRTHPETLHRGDAHWTRRLPAVVARGEKHGRARLTGAEVRRIREMAARGTEQQRIASLFDVCDATVSMIVKRRIWKSVA